MPPGIRSQRGYCRVRRRVIAHLQNNALLLRQQDLNNPPRVDLRLRLGREIRDRGHDDCGCGEGFGLGYRRDVFQAVAETLSDAVLDDGVAFFLLAVDEVDFRAAEEMLQGVDGSAAGSPAADDHAWLSCKTGPDFLRYVLQNGFPDSNAICVRPAKQTLPAW